MTSPASTPLTPTKIAHKVLSKLKRGNAPVLDVRVVKLADGRNVLLTIVIDANRRHELDIAVIERAIDEIAQIADRPVRYTISGRRP